MLERFSLAVESVAKRLALPIWPPEALATKSAVPLSTPSRSVNSFAIALVEGVRSDKCLQRERMVGRTSVNVGAHNNQIVRSPGFK